MTPYIFERGETISLALDAVTGDPLAVNQIIAKLKPVAPGRNSVSAATPVAASFDIAPRVAVGDIPPGWTLTIGATTSALLRSGNYLADARIEIAGGVVISDAVSIQIRESVSG